MKLRFRTSFPLAAFAVWCLPLLAPAADEDAEALTSGPIHEAFAQPVALDQVERYVISQPPPESVDEIPPDEKPEGDNVVWIPGYWQWDDDEEDFIWISGCWRAVPPGTTWVPGYWGETEGGYEWVSGYWQTEEVKETVYLSAPPATLERGPTTPAPSVESVWVQGTWVWRSPTLLRRSRYAWRPGYWLSPRPDWIWVPSRYVYTPRGYVYVDGYWDYVLERRGVLFLPYRLRHRHAVGVGVRFRLTPHFVFDLGFLTDSLFWSPRRCHYYFGDYYGARYVAIGYHPWYETPRHRRAYDPIFVHARWRHRDDRDWERKHRSEYEDRRDRQYERPPRTYRDMKKYVSEHSGPQRPRAGVARPLKDFSQDRNQKVKFEKLSPNRMEEIRSRGRELEDRRRDRSQRETVRERRVTPTDSRPGRSDDRPDAPRTNRVNPVPPLRVDSIGRRRPTPTVPTPEVRRPTPTVPTPEVRRPTPTVPTPEVRRPTPTVPTPEVRRPTPTVPTPEVRRPTPTVPTPEVRRPTPTVPTPEVRRPTPTVPTPEIRRPTPAVPTPEVRRPTRTVPTPEIRRPTPAVPTPEVRRPTRTVPTPEIRRPTPSVREPEVRRPAPAVPTPVVRRPTPAVPTPEVRRPAPMRPAPTVRAPAPSVPSTPVPNMAPRTSAEPSGATATPDSERERELRGRGRRR